MTAITVHRFESLPVVPSLLPRPAPSVEPPLGSAGASREAKGRSAAAGRPSSRPPLPDAVTILIDRAGAGLLEACTTTTATERYVGAHLAALRSAAAVVAVHGQGRRGGPRSVWDLLARIAPELNDWAAFFAATATRRAAIESGRQERVSAQEADALLRAAETFLHRVEELLGLPQYPVLPSSIPPCIS